MWRRGWGNRNSATPMGNWSDQWSDDGMPWGLNRHTAATVDIIVVILGSIRIIHDIRRHLMERGRGRMHLRRCSMLAHVLVSGTRIQVIAQPRDTLTRKDAEHGPLVLVEFWTTVRVRSRPPLSTVSEMRTYQGELHE